MKFFSASSTTHAPRFNAVICLAVLAVFILPRCPVVAQTISTTDLLPIQTSTNSSMVVPIQRPKKLLSRPLQSLANVAREQSVRTRNGIGFRSINVRAQDEIWLVSARQKPQCELTMQRLVDGQWVPAAMEELTDAHAVDQQRASVVYVHGNRTGDEYARSRGLQFYENVFNGESQSGPVRFVIFAWRSEREKIRPTSDYSVKLDRSVELGPTFANFLDQFQDRRIVLAGFSSGSQVILSGLAQLPSQVVSDKVGKFQVALVTPALKAADASNSVASLPLNSTVAKTVVFINRKDNAIRAATLVAKATSMQPAITLEQIAKQPTCEMVNPVFIEDITAQATGCHSITKYSALSTRIKMVLKEMTDEVRGFGH